MGTPSNIDEYTLKRLWAENGAFVHSVTIILLSYLTNLPVRKAAIRAFHITMNSPLLQSASSR